MARSLVDTFAELTLPQQRRVFALLREILETNEQLAALGEEVSGDTARIESQDDRGQ